MTKPFSPVQLIGLVKETLANGAVDSQPRRPSIDTMSLDLLAVYERDLKDLSQRERREREALEQALNRRPEKRSQGKSET
ncbi:MAG: hypothetical protein PVG71_03130 [Anaerolineae bacterium]